MEEKQLSDQSLGTVSLKKFLDPRLEQLAGRLESLDAAIGRASDASERVATSIARATWALFVATVVLIGVTAWNGLSQGPDSADDGSLLSSVENAAGQGPLSLVCSWVAYDRHIESFLVEQTADQITWVNRDLVLPLQEASPARFRFTAEAVPIVLGPMDDGATQSTLNVTINRVSGDFEITVTDPPDARVQDVRGEACKVTKAF